MVHRCASLGILDPEQLASLSRAQLSKLSECGDFADLSVQIWRYAVLTFAAPSAGASNAVRYQSESVGSLRRLIRGAALSTSEGAQRFALACQRLNVNQGCFI